MSLYDITENNKNITDYKLDMTYLNKLINPQYIYTSTKTTLETS